MGGCAGDEDKGVTRFAGEKEAHFLNQKPRFWKTTCRLAAHPLFDPLCISAQHQDLLFAKAKSIGGGVQRVSGL